MFFFTLSKTKILDLDSIDGNFTLTTTVDYDIPIQDMASETLMAISPCHQFEDKFEFYSPGYPQPYPNNTECIRLLEGGWTEMQTISDDDITTILR